MSNPIKTEKMGNLTIKIFQDESPESPREWDNLGKMLCFHRKCELGDKKEGDFKDSAFVKSLASQKGVISLPIFMMDHSGLTLSTDPKVFQAIDSQSWDWGMLGFILVEPEKIRNEYSCKRITKTIREKVLTCLQGEVETYNQFLQGDVYGFLIEDENGNHLDSCWGFYGLDYCLEEAKGNAKHIAESLIGSGSGV